MAKYLLAVLSLGTAGLLLCPNEASAQQLTLEACQHKAEQHYPLTRQYGLIEKTKEYNLSNAGKRYLPQVTLSAKASYQSDVTSLPIDVSSLGLPISIPSVKKDQYGATLDVSQLVYDGGATRAAKKSIEAESSTSTLSNDVSLYSLRKQVSEVYFALLMLQEQQRSHDYYQAQLRRTEEKLQASLRGGIVTRADVDAVHVDYLKGEQTGIALRRQLQAYTEVLALLTGDSLTPTTELVRPTTVAVSSEQERPELRLLSAQQKLTEMRTDELKASLRPTLGLFAQGGYSRPGLNMLKNEFAPYYVVGARLSWNLGNFYTYSGKRKSLEAQNQMLANQADAFRLSQRIQAQELRQTSQSNQEQIAFDSQIVQLKKQIYQTAEARLLGGTLSATDAMRELTSLRLAEQDQIQHDLTKLKADYDLCWTLGE